MPSDAHDRVHTAPRDAPAPAHAFRNHEDEAVYRMCESPLVLPSTYKHVFPVRGPHPPRVPGRRALGAKWSPVRHVTAS